jgi:hypothetical protein
MSAEIDLTDVNVTIEGGILNDVNIDIGGLADIRLKEVNVDAKLNDIRLKEVNVDAKLNDIRLKEVNVDAGLDNIRLKELNVAIKEVAPITTDSKVDLGLDNIRIQELPPFQFEFAFRPIRIHLPLNYSFCLELLGIRLFKFSVCGEGMAIAEDYVVKESERCQ